MASSRKLAKARNAIIGMFVVIAAVIGGIFAFASTGGTWSPKLALDLSGGTQLILAPKVSGDNSGEVNEEQLAQAVDIIRQRVDGSGVAEAEVTTQSGKNVVVSVPGTLDSQTRDLIQASAEMSFRSVLVAGNGAPVAENQRTAEDKLPQPTGEPQDGSDMNWVTADIFREYEAKDCAAVANEDTEAQDPSKPVVACSTDGAEKYILGPVEMNGTDIKDASYSQVQSSQGVSTGQWGVNLELTDTARQKFQDVTSRLVGIGAQNPQDARSRFAIMLDGKVLSAPTSQAVITDGKSQITGNFTEETAKSLSEQLKYGALPISFDIQSEQQISATLGQDQLKWGLIAGAIGLTLVFIYSLFQYRLVGLINIISIMVAASFSLTLIILLGNMMNYRLSLAGVAGLIVSIGLMADSFIVYFERIRDEIRNGRTIAAAIDHGWDRAQRTILASKAVNLLAAVVLYLASVGNVRGFAFTLGLTAISDLIVTYLLIHPMMVLFGHTKYFANGGRFSGMDPEALGAAPLYRGAGRVRTPEENDGMGAAERRRALRLAQEEEEKAAEVNNG